MDIFFCKIGTSDTNINKLLFYQLVYIMENNIMIKQNLDSYRPITSPLYSKHQQKTQYFAHVLFDMKIVCSLLSDNQAHLHVASLFFLISALL